MIKVLIKLGLLLTVIIVGSQTLPLEELKQLNVKFVTSEQMKEFLQQNPNAIELSKKEVPNRNTPSKDTAIVAPFYLIEYTLGNRIAGDYLVGYDDQIQYYDRPLNVKMTVQYPAFGTEGKIVTYVNILIGQSSQTGSAYVTEGGIGYNYIGIIVEAERTTYFRNTVSIYAH